MISLAFIGQPSFWQLMVILVVVLLLFGANRLPKMARNLGSSLTEFKKGLRGESADDDDEDEKIDPPSPEQKSETKSSS
ncbi:MAG: twin-arginine translocase TatA/TatE family subunit [Planctomycetota bacterium]|nr:twin-arginine translocase TatA/TatE family subunit [Planctomycetota bacterium]